MNEQPKITSTDIGELGEDVERPDNMEAIEHAFDEVIKDLILLREHITGFEDARKYDPKHTAGTVPFAPHLSNKSELKKEAVREFDGKFVGTTPDDLDKLFPTRKGDKVK